MDQSSITNIYDNIHQFGKINTEFIKNQLKSLGTFIDDNFSLTPLHLAVIIGDLNLIQQYTTIKSINSKREKQQLSPLHLAIEIGDYSITDRIKIIKFLIDNGADINLKDINNESPLYKACSHYSTQLLVPILIDYGAYVLENDIHTPTNLLLHRWLNQFNIDNGIKDIVKLKICRKLESIYQSLK